MLTKKNRTLGRANFYFKPFVCSKDQSAMYLSDFVYVQDFYSEYVLLEVKPFSILCLLIFGFEVFVEYTTKNKELLILSDFVFFVIICALNAQFPLYLCPFIGVSNVFLTCHSVAHGALGLINEFYQFRCCVINLSYCTCFDFLLVLHTFS